MIRTNDLTLGNWVTYLDKPMQVVGIFPATAYLNFEGNEGDVFEIEEEFLAGIPITEELLEKCGFKRDEKLGFVYHYEHSSLEFIKEGSGGLLTFGINRGIRSNFLHELQNAYYMLTKKELEVKL